MLPRQCHKWIKLPNRRTLSPSLRFRRSRQYSTLLSVGIRREDKNHWERRVPLTPDSVERLVKDIGATVYVQPSSKRVFPDVKYAAAGAIVQEDLSPADVILGVKEVPANQLIPDKTYLFFSHTHKGQKYNMPMLKTILDKRVRLIDYELLTDENSKRLVQFSKFAGYAGMIDCLHGLGHRLLALGYGNPFLAIGMSLDVTRSAITISDDGLPPQIGPLVFIFTGSGNVTKGALHVFKCLPYEWIEADSLKSFYESGKWSQYKVYACRVRPEDYLVRKDGGTYNRSHYHNNAELYESVFHWKIAPYASVIVNGIFWNARYPRLLTIDQMKKLAELNRLRLISVADISCDINGSLEFMDHASTISKPHYMYDPITCKNHENFEGRGIQIMSIDNLPTELPLEASEYFSNALFPHVTQLVKANFEHPVLARATITTPEGTLTDRHQTLYQSIEVSKHRRVLLLGSGYVAAPLVDYLLRVPNCSITIASNIPADAHNLAGNRRNVEAVEMSVQDTSSLQVMIEKHDVIVSFVPATLHLIVAEACIAAKKSMITASYISPSLASLDGRAKQANICILNEVGLDPGIDHLTAMKLFDEVKSHNGRIRAFSSWCGGLPAPEASNNPLGYKFSWSPKGVLLAGLNSARYKLDNEVVEIPGDRLLKSAVDVNIYKGFALEGIPNRDSLKYVDLYGLGRLEDMETMFRGTLRYKGYSELMAAFKDIGLLSADESHAISTETSWPKVLNNLLGGSGQHVEKAAIAARLEGDTAAQARVFSAIDWLGLLSVDTRVQPAATVLDAFCDLLQQKLVYGAGERDMVAMQHEFGIEWSNGSQERRTSTLITYGDPGGYSAMAKTVGLPAAIGTELVLSGLSRRGVFGPMTKDVYLPMLQKLTGEGIVFEESVTKSS